MLRDITFFSLMYLLPRYTSHICRSVDLKLTFRPWNNLKRHTKFQKSSNQGNVWLPVYLVAEDLLPISKFLIDATALLQLFSSRNWKFHDVRLCFNRCHTLSHVGVLVEPNHGRFLDTSAPPTKKTTKDARIKKMVDRGYASYKLSPAWLVVYERFFNGCFQRSKSNRRRASWIFPLFDLFFVVILLMLVGYANASGGIYEYEISQISEATERCLSSFEDKNRIRRSNLSEVWMCWNKSPPHIDGW